MDKLFENYQKYENLDNLNEFFGANLVKSGLSTAKIKGKELLHKGLGKLGTKTSKKVAFDAGKKKGFRNGKILAGAVGAAGIAGGYALGKRKSKPAEPVKKGKAKTNNNVNESISDNQKVFDSKVINTIYNLNESTIVLDALSNAYYLEQLNKAYENKDLNAAMYYESLILV
jgi:hypothetical protein